MYKSCPLECKILKGIWKNAYANDNVFCTTLYIVNFSDPYLFLRVFIFKSLSFPQSLYFQILIFSSESLFSTVHNFNNAKIPQNIVIILAQSFLCRWNHTFSRVGSSKALLSLQGSLRQLQPSQNRKITQNLTKCQAGVHGVTRASGVGGVWGKAPAKKFQTFAPLIF